jgi:hypothetical protein
MFGLWSKFKHWRVRRKVAESDRDARYQAEKALVQAGYCLEHRELVVRRGTSFKCPKCWQEFDSNYYARRQAEEDAQRARAEKAKKVLGW